MRKQSISVHAVVYGMKSMASGLIYRSRPFQAFGRGGSGREGGLPSTSRKVLLHRNGCLFPRRRCDNNSGGSEEMALGCFVAFVSLLLEASCPVL